MPPALTILPPALSILLARGPCTIHDTLSGCNKRETVRESDLGSCAAIRVPIVADRVWNSSRFAGGPSTANAGGAANQLMHSPKITRAANARYVVQGLRIDPAEFRGSRHFVSCHDIRIGAMVHPITSRPGSSFRPGDPPRVSAVTSNRFSMD
jgi:hypothetical protein